MAGRHAGAGISGYYDARRERRRSEEYDYESERQRRINEKLDPIREREAEIMAEQREMGHDEYQYGHEYRKGHMDRENRRGIREDRYAEAEDPVRHRELGRRDRAGERQEGLAEHVYPYQKAAATRAHERAEWEEPFQRRSIARGEHRDRMNIGIEEMQYDDAMIFDQARNAIGSFRLTGDPKVLEDFYNGMYPDDNSVRIEKEPDGGFVIIPEYGEPQYVESAEALASSAERAFMDRELLGQVTGYGGYGGYGGRGGRGRGGAGHKPPADVAETRELMTALRSHPDYQHLSEPELLLEAHKQAAMKGGTPPEESIAKFYMDYLKLVAGNELSRMTPERERELHEIAAARVVEFGRGIGAEDLARQIVGQQPRGGGRGRGRGVGIADEEDYGPMPGDPDYVDNLLDQFVD